MNLQQRRRRKFLQMGLQGAALFAAGGLPGLQQTFAASAQPAPFNSLANLGPLLPPDENGLMLPQGFKSRVLARSGENPLALADYVWHAAPDGGATFTTEDGGWVYVSNSEMANQNGGVGALRFDARGTLVDAYQILQNTSVNCAGGPTPWGSWLSCEETVTGQVYECDPQGKKSSAVRPALGTFKHEAVAVDSLNQCLYLTEDEPDGGFYRFRPALALPDINAGQLEIAAVIESEGRRYIEWLPVPDALAQQDPTRMQVPGYTPFKGGEGIAIHGDVTYFTTKGDNRVWAYDNVSQELTILYDVASSENPILTGVDNVVITSSGDVLVAEDGGDMQIVVLSKTGSVQPLLQIIGHERSEVTGPAFDPSYQRLYFSSQRGALGERTEGITYEISRSDSV